MPNFPNAAPPGSLAESRLGRETFPRIRQIKDIHTITYSASRSQRSFNIIPPAKVAKFADRIATLLYEDRIYTALPTFAPDSYDLEINLNNNVQPVAQIAVSLKASRISVHVFDKGVGRFHILVLDPVGKSLIAAAQQAMPEDVLIRQLVFRPSQKPASPLRSVISLDIRQKLQPLRPGIRRAEAMRFLETEGGISNRLGQQFVVPNSANAKGMLVKVNLGFAPASAPIRWIDGTGYLLETPPTKSRINIYPPQDDIVIRIGEPYYQHMIRD